MSKNIKVIDTSVLLSAGSRALFAFPDSTLVLPMAVIDELESKRQDQLLGFIARKVIRSLESLRKTHGKAMSTEKGVVIDKGLEISLRIETNHVSLDSLEITAQEKSRPSTDTRILAVAANLKKEAGADTIVTLVSNDLPLRLRAEMIAGVEVEELVLPRLYQGDFDGVIINDEVEQEIIDSMYQNSTKSVLSYDDFELSDQERVSSNLGFVLKCGRQSIIARGYGRTKEIRKIEMKEYFQNTDMKLKGVEQHIAMSYLTDPDIGIVSLGGRAGTGKSTMAILAGLQQIQDANNTQTFDRVVVFRNLYAVGNQNLGYLPGTEEEKMGPWALAVDDALDGIYGNKTATKERLKKNKTLEVMPVTHIRGRTFTNTFIIIDEAQNFDALTLLNIITRVGSGSKIVLCWDAAQSDNMSVSPENGIIALVNEYVSDPAFAHVTLTKSQRSDVANRASLLLEKMSNM